jgi:hypothetical protein
MTHEEERNAMKAYREGCKHFVINRMNLMLCNFYPSRYTVYWNKISINAIAKLKSDNIVYSINVGENAERAY